MGLWVIFFSASARFFAAAAEILSAKFGGVRVKAMWKLKVKNGRKTSISDAGSQCRCNRTPNPSLCPLLWDFTDRKQFHKRVKFSE